MPGESLIREIRWAGTGAADGARGTGPTQRGLEKDEEAGSGVDELVLDTLRRLERDWATSRSW